MKVKQQPTDFQVEELTDVAAGADGAYALYRLTKSGWTTHDALEVVRRRWKLERQRISVGGLKDRHALTKQFFTVLRGPQRKMAQQEIEVEYVGQVPRPFASEDIRANKFQITLRALTEQQIDNATVALAQVGRDGLPNYFDDQRFGSVGASGQFAAKEIVLGRFEEALKMALAAPYEHDRSVQKKEKAILRLHWGNWAACREQLPRSRASKLLEFLVHHPDDFPGALDRLNPDLRGLYLSAYQSHLWNSTLARWIEKQFSAEKLRWVSLRRGKLPVPSELEGQQQAEMALHIPLPSPRVVLGEDPVSAALQDVLLKEGINLEQLRLPGFKKMFFSRGERAAWFFPAGLGYNSGTDDLHPARNKLQLAFELPRGCYATLLIKRITAE